MDNTAIIFRYTTRNKTIPNIRIFNFLKEKFYLENISNQKAVQQMELN